MGNSWRVLCVDYGCAFEAVTRATRRYRKLVAARIVQWNTEESIEVHVAKIDSET